MMSRWLSGAAAAWTAGLLGLYLWITQETTMAVGVAWWMVGVLLVAACLASCAAAGKFQRGALAACVPLLAVATIAGLLSIGLLLLPAFAGALTALVLSSRRPVSASTPASGLQGQ